MQNHALDYNVLKIWGYSNLACLGFVVLHFPVLLLPKSPTKFRGTPCSSPLPNHRQLLGNTALVGQNLEVVNS